MKIKNVILIAICVFLVASLVAFVGIFIRHSSQPSSEKTFKLSEITDGVYAYKETVVSSIPAYNYTIITICDQGGYEHTIKGSVRIVYQDAQQPYAVVKYYDIVYADEITLYVPSGTVQYLGTSTVGR